MSVSFFMHTYLIFHNINSSVLIQKLESKLSSIAYILSNESNNNYYTYEIQTNIQKEDFVKILMSIVNSLLLDESERVVLYDTNIFTSFLEMPNNNEKIILNGNIEIENKVEKIIIEIFNYIKFKQVLEKVQAKYFDSILEKHNTQY